MLTWYSNFKTAGRREGAWLTGTLKRTDDGFVYVNVPNDIINGFYYALEHDETIQPPYRDPKYSGIGAHISAFDSEEIKDRDITEVGRRIDYRTKGIFHVDPERGKMARIWAVEVESPQLEEIRKRYGLSPLLRGHPFHVTFAILKK